LLQLWGSLSIRFVISAWLPLQLLCIGYFWVSWWKHVSCFRCVPLLSLVCQLFHFHMSQRGPWPRKIYSSFTFFQAVYLFPYLLHEEWVVVRMAKGIKGDSTVSVYNGR
jgi:hypothetical protein